MLITWHLNFQWLQLNYSGTSYYTIPFPVSFMNNMTGIGGIDYPGQSNNGLIFRIHLSTTNSLLSIYGSRVGTSISSRNEVYGKFIIIGY